ncbi:MAG: pyrroline-5-carboxylate reductase [Elainellaceae cyanobacterium]
MIGGGVMGEALVRRLIEKTIYSPHDILISDPQATRLAYLRERYGVKTTERNSAAADGASLLLLAVKPQIFGAVAAGLSLPSSASESPLIVSILAGISISVLESAFPHQAVVRAMPNAPATVGAGMTAIAAGSRATAEHVATAIQLFSAVGQVVQVPEHQMDAVTGLSGSGPGYIAIVVEALADGGVAAGLSRAVAMQLAIQTVRGTAELLAAAELHPAQLKDRVTSPGGTTIAGIASLEQSGLRSALIEAVKAASQRSQELGQS